ncbi:MAG TPA: LysR family transcriptional regulator [Polyangiaceae bacterium]|nr:LysR family transcriptional regulator [Polyangiaceae bacterium]
MDLTLFRSLLAVAEHGAVTDAATALGLSQSALSRRMDQLGEELGAPLIERVGRGVALTAVGQIAVEEGKLLVQRYDRLKSRIHEHLRLDAGVVRIGGGATAVGFLLPGAIAAFRKQHPGVVFQVKEAGSREIEAAVGSEELELGIVTLPTHTREVEERPLARDRIVLVAAKDHPLARRERIDARALNGQNLVGFEAGSAVRWLIDAALREAQVEVNVVMELRSVAAILQMVETTGSLAFVSELSVVSEPSRRGRAVVPVAVRGLEIQRDLALISKRGRSLSPAARAFSRSLS